MGSKLVVTNAALHTRISRHMAAGLSIAALACALAVPAQAQDAGAQAEQEGTKDGEIVVTARKFQESILEVPLSVSAVTGTGLEKRGITQARDLEDAVAGLEVSENNSGKSDRSVQTFTLRGFTPASGVESTVSVFIDGVPVSSTTALQSIASPARIEVLRGPQAAYFGRNTFAGAVNVVTRDASNSWTGLAEATFGTFDTQRLRAEISGPIVTDILSFRSSAEYYHTGGQYVNEADGQRLGKQESQVYTLQLDLTPSDALRVKAFGMRSLDDDGPSASALISAYDIEDFVGNVLVQGQPNCVQNGNPYFCGSIPTKIDPLAYNSALTPAMEALLANPTNRLNGVDLIDGYGMGREYDHAHLTIDYDLGGGLSLASLTGFNEERWTILNDIDHYFSSTFNYGFMVERMHRDWSQELRARFDNGGALSGTIGGSYLDAKTFGTLTGIAFSTPAAVTPAGMSEAETYGIFGGISYKLSDALELSFEGRYQVDEISSFDPAGNLQVRGKFENFLPRAILDYQFTDDLMFYASYAKGVNPSTFNTGLLQYSPEVYEAAVAAGLTLTTEPETVDSFDAGIKGSLFDGAMSFALGGYFAAWKKQINRINLVVDVPSEPDPVPVSGVANTGRADLYGVEFEAVVKPVQGITMNLSGAYTASDIKAYSNLLVTSLTGVSDFSGKEMPGVAKFTGNIGVQYDGRLGAGELPFFVRADFSHRSGQWVNQANLLKTDPIDKVNLRAGITFDAISLQAFVNNLFEDKSYTAASDYFAFTYNFAYFGNNSALLASLPQKRTAGVTAKVSF
ncbi:TonB-dependent receptor domain-containing protein [Croceicoccus sp. BE223]|uniref:TonB-dependent receptor n=1 Tax=Croceicoccus sp. BE223 TaxID=2817716 RepID=UPI00285AFB45|nr:TonB-dependent receptor [Croceicoccus sp. BE223]MDR7102288.1 iron complex outermembrane receptor protein [Croceicoccus sp. BE223]